MDFTLVPAEELERDIYSTGFYKAKARNIQLCCSQLIERFGGEIPQTMEELQKNRKNNFHARKPRATKAS